MSPRIERWIMTAALCTPFLGVAEAILMWVRS